MKQLIITRQEAGQRLDKLLGKYLNKAPKSFLYKMLRKKNITLNGRKAAGNEQLQEGDEVKLFFSEETFAKFSQVKIQKTDAKLDVIYEDAHVLLMNKPCGILSQKSKDTDISMVEHLISHLLAEGAVTEESLRTFRPSVVNRLDRNTSGILAAGKDLAGAQMLSGLFRDRSLHKYYYCLVKGVLKEKKRISGYLTKDGHLNRVSIHSEASLDDAMSIETEYEPLQTNGEVTLLKVLLVTGRSHQIRAHLSSIGHPIVGDFKYGDPALNAAYEERYRLKSQLLHSGLLVFPELPEPFSYLGGRTFWAPYPKKFSRILKGEGFDAWPLGTRGD